MARNYHIGRFTELASFVRPTWTVTKTGERETAYVDCGCRYGEVDEDVRADELAAEALAEGQTLCFKCWEVRAATTEWRVRLRGMLFQVVKVVPQRSHVTFYYLRRIDLCNA